MKCHVVVEDFTAEVGDSFLADDTLCDISELATYSIIPIGHCPIMAFLPVRLHCVNARRNRCQENLNSFPFGEQQETTRTLSCYLDESYRARQTEIQKPLRERSNCRVSESSTTLETDVYVWRYALLVVHGTQEEEEVLYSYNCIIIQFINQLLIICELDAHRF